MEHLGPDREARPLGAEEGAAVRAGEVDRRAIPLAGDVGQ
jgi:hypothetical protein